jgi:cytochrome c peroxidase
MRKLFSYSVAALAVSTAAVAVRADTPIADFILRQVYNTSVRYSTTVEFPQRIGARGDVARGRRVFGFNDAETAIDNSGGLFQGQSQLAGTVTSNGKVCATCHRSEAFQYGMPPLPLSATIPLNDPVFNTAPEDGADPNAFFNADTLGLFAYRPNRFNPLRPDADPLRQVFFWRKTQRLLNVVFTFGLLNDGRFREMVEQARGAVFTHTQNGDDRFDDLVAVQRLLDIGAFQESHIDPPELGALLDPADPNYATLVNDPFHTVNLTTNQERLGETVFANNCMSCHNMPNVFSNVDHLNGPPLNFPPLYGHNFDIGVSQRNRFNLDVRKFDTATGTRVAIVLPLVTQDGRTLQYTVADDVGAAGSTGRFEDLHKFKVPQLRRVSQMAPYFHDGSATTLEEAVDYFNTAWYNDSAEGQLHPIHLSQPERSAMLAFLRAL